MLSNLQVMQLSILSKGNMSGYDLTKYVEEQGLKISHQQVYRELKKLEAGGFLECTLVPQDGKPDKKLYGLSVNGFSTLANYVEQTEPKVPKWQDEASAMVFTSDISFFYNYRLALTNELDRLNKVEDSLLPVAKRLHSRRTVLVKADLDWCDSVISELSNLKKTA